MSEHGPRTDDGGWCCMCGVHLTETNGREECPVSKAQMATRKGLSHLWAYGTHERAMRIWKQDAEIRDRLAA